MEENQSGSACTRRQLLQWIGGTACASSLGPGQSIALAQAEKSVQVYRVEKP